MKRRKRKKIIDLERKNGKREVDKPSEIDGEYAC